MGRALALAKVANCDADVREVGTDALVLGTAALAADSTAPRVGVDRSELGADIAVPYVGHTRFGVAAELNIQSADEMGGHMRCIHRRNAVG